MLQFFPKGGRGFYGKVSVDCNGVVDGGNGRDIFLNGLHTVRQALVVMGDIVFLKISF